MEKLTREELERRMAEIDAREPEQPTRADLEALMEADAEDPAESVTLEESRARREYNGRLTPQTPQEPHRQPADEIPDGTAPFYSRENPEQTDPDN